MHRRKFVFLFLVIFMFSCTKDEDNHPPVADFTYEFQSMIYTLISNSTDKESDVLTYDWYCSADSIDIINSDKKTAYFSIPSLDEPLEVTISLVVSDGEYSDSVSRTIVIPATSLLELWGLGKSLQEEKSNNTNYEWYMDQMGTGSCSSVNCGPTSATMAIKWFSETFDKTPEDARNTYYLDCGWWYTNNIIDYLDKYTVNNKTISITTTDVLINELDNDNIMILCLDMYYIRKQEADEMHVDKFYSAENTGWGHFIVIKGYKKVDDITFFEVYDPCCFGKLYSNNTLKGKDRYYRDEDINLATNNWWDYAIVISHTAFKSSDGVDVRKIEHKNGG